MGGGSRERFGQDLRQNAIPHSQDLRQTHLRPKSQGKGRRGLDSKEYQDLLSRPRLAVDAVLPARLGRDGQHQEEANRSGKKEKMQEGIDKIKEVVIAAVVARE